MEAAADGFSDTMDALAKVLCVAYVRFCIIEVGKRWWETGQTPPDISTIAFGSGCGTTMSFTDDEAPPTVVPDGMVSVEQSVSAIDWLMYGHCLTRESSPPLAPVRLAMENDRARWHSVARGSPRRYGHRPRKRDGDTRVKSIWCGRKILGRIRRPLEFPACAELNNKPRCPLVATLGISHRTRTVQRITGNGLDSHDSTRAD